MELIDIIKQGYLKSYTFLGDIRLKRRAKEQTSKCTEYVLNAKEKEELRAFWKPYTNVNKVFCEFYTEKTGEFSVEYMPDDLYYSKIDKFYNDWFAAAHVDNKCYYENIFGVNNVKHPATILYRINGIWLDEKRELISLETLKKMINSESELFVKKAVDSAGGQGVTYINNENGDIVKWFFSVVGLIDKDIVVQLPIKQHKELAKLNKSSVNTIRVLSLLTQNEVKIYSSVVRMGINDAKVDNASSGGITCGIEDDGTLKNVAYSKYGDRYDCHPSTGLEFSSVKIPSFEKVKGKRLIKQCL